jgi:WD40 repeat protein
MHSWISKPMKKISTSSIITCAFHPTFTSLLLCGSTDRTCKLVYAIGLEDEPSDANSAISKWKADYGEIVWDCLIDGWVNSVAWSRDTTACFAGHDTTLHIYEFSFEHSEVIVVASCKLELTSLPLVSVLFSDDSNIVGASFDGNLYQYSKKSSHGKKRPAKEYVWQATSDAMSVSEFGEPLTSLCKVEGADSSGSVQYVYSATSVDGSISFWQS